MSHAHLTLGDKLLKDSQEAEDEEDDRIKREKILVIPSCHLSKGDNVLMSGDLWSRRGQWSTPRSSSFSQQWDRLCPHKAPRVSWQLRRLWSVSHPQDWRQSSRCIWNMSCRKSGIIWFCYNSLSIHEMYLRCPELRHDPVWPGVVGEHVAPLSPGDQVQGPDQGEGVRGVTRGDHTKITRAIRQPENARVGEIRIYHWKKRR